MKIANNIIELIGNTPLVKLNKITTGLDCTLVGKLEFYNPASSVKDRIGAAMIEAAEKEGLITKDTTIIEATSGNTGIALAWVCAVKGYKLILTMPETMSAERRSLLKAFGAELILTPAEAGMKGSLEKAVQLFDQMQPAFIPRQFDNPANPSIHEKTTAEEIWADTDGKIDILVAGVGTGGTITGTGKALKKKSAKIKIIAVEPDTSAVLSGEKGGPHMIQGIGAGFIPSILEQDIIDEVVKISSAKSFAMTKRLAREEGIIAGISSGAAVAAALEIASKPESKDKLIVIILPDTGERYLSLPVFNN